MKPTTFQIRLHVPFGVGTLNTYVLYIHVESYADALTWVQRVFSGIDVRPTLFRLENPSKVSRIGNTDPVAIINCDRFPCYVVKDGKRVAVPSDPDVNRRSADEVCDGLYELVDLFQQEYKANQKNLAYFTARYAETGAASDKENIAKCHYNIERAKLWRNAVWHEYVNFEQSMKTPSEKEASEVPPAGKGAKQTQPCSAESKRMPKGKCRFRDSPVGSL